jgi:hypothetical protein
MSSRPVEGEPGVFEISAPVYSTMPVGHRLYVADTYAARSAALRRFDDYLARLALSQPSNGHAWGEGVAVKPPEDALLESLRNGSVHASLVEEPRAA